MLLNKIDKGSIAIVLGLGPAGLFLSRQLKSYGLNVIGFGKSDDIGRYSKALERCYITESIDEIYNILSDICKDLDYKPVGFVCSDQYLTLIIEDCEAIFELLDFSEPSEEHLRLIADKERLLQLCNRAQINTPLVYDTDALAHICFPVIVKPNIKRGHSPIAKVSFANNNDELSQIIDQACQVGISRTELLVQQCVRGNNLYEYGYGGYFENGHPVTDIYFRQVRQYPQGVSCHIIEITEPDIIEKISAQTSRFLRTTNYSGFLQFDLKEDEISGEVFVLDINPRPWGSVSALLKYCRKSTVFEKEDSNSEAIVKWRFPLKELFSYKHKGNVPYNEIRKLYKGRKVVTIVDLYDWHDLKPVSYTHLTLPTSDLV